MIKTLSIFGTRPEAIKMAPLVLAMREDSRFFPQICVTGQHREMLDQVLTLFGIQPDHDLNIMRPNQSLSDVSSAVLLGLKRVFSDYKPDIVMVHGDTATTFAAALSAFYHRIPVAHVEAGLRSGSLLSPWPEEANRKLTGVISSLHFAPTPTAAASLLSEGVDSANILITGNTVIDALLHTIEKCRAPENIIHFQSSFPFLKTSKKFILVTCHRRENWGQGLNQVCHSLIQIAIEFPDVNIVFPVHLNPNIHTPVYRELNGRPNIFLVEPLEYMQFTYLMDQCHIILTDSGGIQEEAPSLGKPVLVMRDTTERPEAVESGSAKLVGTDQHVITDNIRTLLTDQRAYLKMSQAHNPFGDGKASARILDWIFNHLHPKE